jgi:hypothetical protein
MATSAQEAATKFGDDFEIMTRDKMLQGAKIF